MNVESKRPWQSRTVVSAFVGIALAFAIKKWPEHFAFLDGHQSAVVELILALTPIFVLWGRTKADRPVTFRK